MNTNTRRYKMGGREKDVRQRDQVTCGDVLGELREYMCCQLSVLNHSRHCWVVLREVVSVGFQSTVIGWQGLGILILYSRK